MFKICRPCGPETCSGRCGARTYHRKTQQAHGLHMVDGWNSLPENMKNLAGISAFKNDSPVAERPYPRREIAVESRK